MEEIRVERQNAACERSVCGVTAAFGRGGLPARQSPEVVVSSEPPKSPKIPRSRHQSLTRRLVASDLENLPAVVAQSLRLAMAGGWLLALNAGYVNAVTLMGPAHRGVSHMTGVVSQLGVEVVEPQFDVWILLGLVVAFVVGATISGLVIGAEQLRTGRRYGVLLMAESAILAAAAWLLPSQPWWSAALAALAMGMQNAMATAFSGAVIRTTHLTGVLTDVGILLGHALRGRSVPWWRLFVFGAIVSGFVSGAILAGLAWEAVGPASMWGAAMLTGLTGAIYFVARVVRGQQ